MSIRAMTHLVSLAGRAKEFGVLWLLALLLTCPLALADFAPLGRHHAPAGNASGLGAGTVSLAGGYSTTVPLALPQPRGNLSVPLSVVHTGGNQIGAAGLGWSVPIGYVARSSTASKRKPAFDGPGADSVPRVFMSLGSAETLMNRTGPNTYRAFSSDAHGELTGIHYSDAAPRGVWRFSDQSGREYLFEQLQALSNDSLWILTQISDPTGNRVVLEYQVIANGPWRELNITRVQHTFGTGAASFPKYEIVLKYVEQSAVLSFAFTHGTSEARKHLLDKILVNSRPANSQSPVVSLRTYEFSYTPDKDTGVPRLVGVDLRGRQSAGPLPVARYSARKSRLWSRWPKLTRRRA